MDSTPSLPDRIQTLVLETFQNSKIRESMVFLQNQSKQSKHACNKKYWTILGAFVVEDTTTNSLDVVSLSAGTKSTGKKFMRKDGLHLNDCHAEVLARRGLILYMQSNWTTFFNEKDELRPEIKFHLYVSEVPCGDASMGLEKAKVEGVEEDKYIDTFVKKRDQKYNDKEIQKGHWSGAKTIEGQMSLEIALPRLKSGRSDLTDEQRSLSMSCSDKILMWNIMGI